MNRLRVFPFYKASPCPQVSEIVVKNSCKSILLRSILKVVNHYSHPVRLYKPDSPMDSPNYLCTIEANKEYHMPIEKVYQKPYELWFSIHDPNRHGQPTTNMGIE